LVIGLRNADIDLSEKGFYSMTSTLLLLLLLLLLLSGSIAVQKNTRDLKAIKRQEESIDEL